MLGKVDKPCVGRRVTRETCCFGCSEDGLPSQLRKSRVALVKSLLFVSGQTLEPVLFSNEFETKVQGAHLWQQ